MFSIERYRDKLNVSNLIGIPVFGIRKRWLALSFILAAGLLASACASTGNNEGGYLLKQVGNRLEDKSFGQLGVIRSVSFWLDRNYSVDYTHKGSVAMEVCFRDKGIMQLVSEQVRGKSGLGFLFAGRYAFDDNCTSAFAKFGALHPVTDLDDPETDLIFVGTNKLNNLRTYLIRRNSEDLYPFTVQYLGLADLTEPIISKEGIKLNP